MNEHNERTRHKKTILITGFELFGGDLMQTRRDFRRIFREKLSPAAKTGGKMHIPLSLQVFDRYFWDQREAWAS